MDDLSSKQSSGGSIAFRRTDVRLYNDTLALFQLAYETHGKVDHAFAIAGVTESPNQNWFDDKIDLQSIAQQPSTTMVDVNLTGVLYFARIAAVFLRQGNEARKQDKSICLMGSVASFKEQAGLFVYQPTKHGVLGLVRSSRKYFQECLGIRLNIVCPSMTKTRMATPVLKLWEDNGVAGNDPEIVADFVLTLASVPYSPYIGSVCGLAVYVEANKGWEIEKDLDKSDALWIGEEMSKNALKIEEALGNGGSWVNPSL